MICAAIQGLPSHDTLVLINQNKDFDVRFHVRQFPFNPVYLTPVSASKSRDKNISA
jgi:hypothetical protein